MTTTTRNTNLPENPIPAGPVDVTEAWLVWALRRIAERLTEGSLPLAAAFDRVRVLVTLACQFKFLDDAVAADLTQHVVQHFPAGPTAPSVAVLALAYADLIEGNDVELAIVDEDEFTGDPALGFARKVEKLGGDEPVDLDAIEDNIDDMLDMLDELEAGERPSDERVRAAVGTTLRQLASLIPSVDESDLDGAVLDADEVGRLAAVAKLVPMEQVVETAMAARKTDYTRENAAKYVTALADLIDPAAQSIQSAA